MKYLLKLKHYLYPYWKQSVLALTLLTAVVFMDLAIPRLVQRSGGNGAGRPCLYLVAGGSVHRLGHALAESAAPEAPEQSAFRPGLPRAGQAVTYTDDHCRLLQGAFPSWPIL